MTFLETLGGEPLDHLVAADDGSSALTRNHLDIGNVVEVAMGEKDVVRLEGCDVNRGGQGIGRDEGVDEQCRYSNLNGEA